MHFSNVKRKKKIVGKLDLVHGNVLFQLLQPFTKNKATSKLS